MVLLIDKDKIQSYSERNDSTCCREMWNGGGKNMTESEARVILTRMRDGCDPFTGEALPEDHPYASLKIAAALHIALRAMDGITLGTQYIERAPKRVSKQDPERVRIRRTETALGHSGTNWTKEDKLLLALRIEQRVAIEEIAQELKRTPFEIQERINRSK